MKLKNYVRIGLKKKKQGFRMNLNFINSNLSVDGRFRAKMLQLQRGVIEVSMKILTNKTKEWCSGFGPFRTILADIILKVKIVKKRQNVVSSNIRGDQNGHLFCLNSEVFSTRDVLSHALGAGGRRFESCHLDSS